MAKLKKFWAARVFGYGAEYPMLDVGQVIEIEPGQQQNDEKLIRLGHLRELGPERPVQCGQCSAKFLNEGFLSRHGKNQHAKSATERGRSEDPNLDLESAEELGRLKAIEDADKFAEDHLPLNLDKTKASMDASR